MRHEHTKPAIAIGIFGLSLIALSLLSGCGKQVGADGLDGANGATGAQGAQGYGAGILSESVAGLCGATDGVRLTTFQDKNNNGILNSGETVNAITSVCNGANGSNGTNGMNGTSSTVSISTSALSCGVAGGYTMTVTNGAVTTSYSICNGLNGIQGPQGQQGIQGATGSQGIPGINGLNGTNGTLVTPVKFCNSDHSAYPEYGLLVGNALFAVYWGTTPASPNVNQAFLSEITAGTYKSTGGNNCTFTITANNTVQ